jgi:hypothetical protein
MEDKCSRLLHSVQAAGRRVHIEGRAAAASGGVRSKAHDDSGGLGLGQRLPRRASPDRR